jgi:hypothetical protein
MGGMMGKIQTPQANRMIGYGPRLEKSWKSTTLRGNLLVSSTMKCFLT